MADAANKDETVGNQDGESQEQAPAAGHGRILTDQESAEWGLDTTIEEKTPEAQKNVLREELETATKGKTDDAGDATEAQETAQEHTEEDAGTVEEEAGSQADLIEDPGEFQPSDYSFEVTVYNEKGEKPKNVKIGSIEEWEKLLEDEPNLGSSVAVNRAFRAAQKMESGIERERQEHEQRTKEYQEAAQAEQVRQERNQSIFNEMSYMMNRGDLPKLTQEEMNNLNWDDPAVLKAHPNIAPHKELLAYMVKENKARAKSGLPGLSSALDALNAMQVDTRRQADIEAKKAAGEARKAAGARVSSASSMPLSAAAPRGIAVGRNVGDLSSLGQGWRS